jgi:hypothetical protein
MYRIIYSSQARKDAKKISESGLKIIPLTLLKYYKTIPFKIHRHMKNYWAICLALIPGELTFNID